MAQLQKSKWTLQQWMDSLKEGKTPDGQPADVVKTHENQFVLVSTCRYAGEEPINFTSGLDSDGFHAHFALPEDGKGILIYYPRSSAADARHGDSSPNPVQVYIRPAPQAVEEVPVAEPEAAEGEMVVQAPASLLRWIVKWLANYSYLTTEDYELVVEWSKLAENASAAVDVSTLWQLFEDALSGDEGNGYYGPLQSEADQWRSELIKTVGQKAVRVNISLLAQWLVIMQRPLHVERMFCEYGLEEMYGAAKAAIGNMWQLLPTAKYNGYVFVSKKDIQAAVALFVNAYGLLQLPQIDDQARLIITTFGKLDDGRQVSKLVLVSTDQLQQLVEFVTKAADALAAEQHPTAGPTAEVSALIKNLGQVAQSRSLFE